MAQLFNQHTCRTCMCKDNEATTTETVKFISIYDEPTENVPTSIANLLMETTPNFCVQPNDLLPQMICSNCLQTLLQLSEFQAMCLRSQTCMRQLLVEAQKTDQTPAAVIIDCNSQLITAFKKEEAEEELQTYSQDPLETDVGELPLVRNDVKFNSVKLETAKEDESNLNETENVQVDVILEVGNECIKLAETECVEAPTSTTKTNSKIELEHACKFCNKKYGHKRALTKHFKVKHEQELKQQAAMMFNTTEETFKPYECSYCKKAFQQLCSLKDHIRTHTGEQPYLCSDCGKAFSSSSNMRQHLLRHSGEKRYECPDCPKKFPCASDLASHKAIHTSVKRHICDICGFAFGKPYELKKHKMYHNGEKPHKCEYCDMRFVCADHARRHTRTHTGEKPYKCKYCMRAFTQSNDLIKHLRFHLGPNVYRCELCPLGFRLASELRKHFSQHKNDDEGTRQQNLKALKAQEEELIRCILKDKSQVKSESQK